jgi:hypothetical protein
MKQCPKCGQTYADRDLNFCYNDGEFLTFMAEEQPTRVHERSGRPFADDPPPTEFMGSARVTRETNWSQAQPPQEWQGGQQMVDRSQYPGAPLSVYQSQTLAIVSLGLGVGAMTIGWCCSTGLLLSPAALITGFIAISQINKDPSRYGGKGLAIGGIVAGAIFLALYLLFIIIYGAALFLGPR